jgi:hypothetical protein
MAVNDNKSIKPGAIPIYVSPEGTKFYREEDIQDDVREQLRKQRDDPEFQRKLRENVDGPNWEYAVAKHELPEGADAAIVRFPDPLARPLLVFQEKSLDDRLVSLARVTLVYVRSTSQPLTAQQLVLVWADGSIKIDGTPDKLENHSFTAQGETAKFRKRAGTARNVQGLGEVRVIGRSEEF